MTASYQATRRTVCVGATFAFGALLSGNPARANTLPASGNTIMHTGHVNTVYDLSLCAAQELLAKGLGIGSERKLRLAISIVDRAGNLLAFARMDGAAIVTVDVAIGKARTAAYLKAPSKLFEDMINSGTPSMATTPGLVPLQGGMPVLRGDEVVGAVGVSGSSGESDQEIAGIIAAALAGI